MIIGGSIYYELPWDNYKPRGGKWVKMSKEEAKEYDNDPNISAIFTLDMKDQCSSLEDNYPDDIDELEYNGDDHAIFLFLDIPWN